MTGRSAILAAMLVALLARPALAGPSAAEAASGALQLARHHYEKGDYARAAGLFHEAFGIDPVPAYLFNAARAEQRGFLLDEAERDFGRFLGLPGAESAAKARAETHLKEVRETRAQLAATREQDKKALEARLRAELAARTKAEKALEQGGTGVEGAAGPGAQALEVGPVPRRQPVDPTPSPTPTPGLKAPATVRAEAPAWRGVAAWSGLGTGAACLLGAGGLWLWASGDQSALDEKNAEVDGEGYITGISYGAAKSEQESINSRLLGAEVLGGVGLLAAGLGAWLLLSEPERASLRLGPRSVGVAWAF
jgi:tetratricopeptide (TPR) repeat protein